MKNTSGFLFRKDVKTNFTKIPNEIFALDVDPYAKLILAYLHSKSPDFVFYRKTVGEVLGISRQKVSRALNQLVESSFLLPVAGGYTMLLTVTRDVTESNTVDVTSGTDRVTPGTDNVLKVTPDVTESNTNKKTEINKTKYKEGINTFPEPTPLRGFGSETGKPVKKQINKQSSNNSTTLANNQHSKPVVQRSPTDNNLTTSTKRNVINPKNLVEFKSLFNNQKIIEIAQQMSFQTFVTNTKKLFTDDDQGYGFLHQVYRELQENR